MDVCTVRPVRDEADRISARVIQGRVLEQESDVGSTPDSSDGSTCFLAFLDGEAVGTLQVTRKGDQGRLADMAVLPLYQRQGVGRAMIRAVVDWGRDKGIREITLQSPPSARAFFLAIRFRESGAPYLEAGRMCQDMGRELVSET